MTEVTIEEAKLARDKHVLSLVPEIGEKDKETAIQLLGVTPENFDKIKNQQLAIENEKNEIARQQSAQAYEDIITLLKQWIDIPEDDMKLIAIWIIGTYFHKEFSTYPYLFFNAVRGSGKTRLLSLVSWLIKNGNGNVLNNPSEPVLFRTASERGLILDEMESEKSKDKQTMREYLNSCYKKGGQVMRMEKQKVDGKEKQVAVAYPLFTPVALANINGIDDVLSDRAITLVIEKSMNSALVKKIENFNKNESISSIKRTLETSLCRVCNVECLVECWNEYVDSKYTSLHTLHTIHNSTYTTYIDLFNIIDGTGIYGRNLELFFPLMLTAYMLHPAIFEEIVEIVKKKNVIKRTDEYAESKDVSLIEFVAQSEKYRFEQAFIHDLLREFKEFVGVHSEDGEDKWINNNWLGLALKRLQLITSRKRVTKGVMVTLNIDKAKTKLNMFKVENKE